MGHCSLLITRAFVGVDMRFAGKEYDGKGVLVALIDSGINVDGLPLGDGQCTGYGLSLQATNHVRIGNDFQDLHGHGTRIAQSILNFVPRVQLMSIRVTDAQLRVDSDLLAAGIELAYKSKADVIHVSMGTSNMGRALLLRDSCIAAKNNGSVVVSTAHPKGERTYPADLPEVVGVSTNRDCRSLYHFPKRLFPKKQWKGLSNKFLAPAFVGEEYSGVSFATAYVTSFLATLAQAFPKETPDQRIQRLAHRAHWPTVELGYHS